MIKYRAALICLLIISRTNSQTPFSPADLVNPLMGTDSKQDLSNGNTYPSISLPWGMNAWMPQTGKMGDGWAYTYPSNKIVGFRQTHQPSPWINDYGQFSIMPVTGKPELQEQKRASWFSHKSETARPYYYSVYLADYDVTAELTPTERAAQFRFTFPQTDSSFVIIDAFDKGSEVSIDTANRTVSGYSTRNSGGTPENFKNYFVIHFDKPFSSAAVWSDSTIQTGTSVKAPHSGALIRFNTHKGEKVGASVASSFISNEQAVLNLQEIGNNSFETTRNAAKKIWNSSLSRIRAEGGTEEQLKTFYSCLYRTMLFPRKFYEHDNAGKIVHYSPYNGKVLPGYMFTDNGFWDTFRAVFPLFNLVEPELSQHIQEGLVNAYNESGWLPEWASPGHRDCMIGSNSASIIAEAWLKNPGKYDINKLYEGIVKSSENEGPVSSVGRKGYKYYNELGYIPYDVNINENTARTLEYAYDDYAAWQLAKKLKRPKAEIDLFAKRCQNYLNVFDSSSKLMRGRNKDGSFQSPFNPFKWGDAFTEGNSWHYTWSVFHDMKGLIGLMGGKKEFVKMLDSVFIVPPIFDNSYYKFTIHEIREMQIANMGNYAHGNQPIQHMIYLYNYAGEPWKTQYWVREVMDRLYKPTPDGYCGDEDNGQTSAWYIFSSMGFYPVTPASDQYVLGAPLFKKITVSLDNGKKIVINAPANDAEHRYVKSFKLNGAEWPRNWISHKTLTEGSTIEFGMSSVADRKRGTADSAAPYSFSGQDMK